MHLEILVEEPSAEEALKILLPRLIPSDTTYRLINFQGKQNLLKQLPRRLRGYASWITHDYRIVVLVDEDRQNCHDLKQQMETAAQGAGLSTKTSVGAARLRHFDISMQAIQERRDKVQVPRGLKLHQYANLYFHARNPMLFKRKSEVERLCVLQVSIAVFNLPGTVITDQNASSDYVRFLPPSAINGLELEKIYAEDWRHPNDPIAYYRHKSQKCAEVLVPHVIPPEFITGAYVVDESAKSALFGTGFPHTITIHPFLFWLFGICRG